MAGRKRNAPTRSSPRATRSRAAAQNPVPSVYREMLSEANVTKSRQNEESSEPPPKRRKRPGERPDPKSTPKEKPEAVIDGSDDDVDFEDVVIPAPTVQTMMREDSEEEEDDDVQFEDLDDSAPSAVPAAQGSGELTLNLNVHRDVSQRIADRRKAIGREEKDRRIEVHKMHLLCLLAHVERRNRWCNDAAVQDALEPLLTEKMVRLLNPRPTLIQFGRTESLKNGLLETSGMFKPKFRITERGMKRALWPEDQEQLKDYKPPDDAETTLEKSDFLEAAKTLEGSRDVGAQLFCALLRCAGVEARLVCSLQPLGFAPGAPTIPKPRKAEASTRKQSKGDVYAAAMAKYETPVPTPSPRRRLGHPNAAAFSVPSLAPPPPPREPAPAVKRIRGESPVPIYWVEVLDVAHQKWHPIDPIVTGTQWRPRALEPPANDRENCMSYVVAFEADGSARDVTRRYVKAYNSKTKRLRIDGMNLPANRTTNTATVDGSPPPLNAGERWWRRALRRYRRPSGPTDLDQIELTELLAEEAKEPMPRNVADFKDHPVYALERHLRRHEILIPGAQPSGTVSAGAKAPLERIYRRRDVRLARSRDKWYRLGRIVKPGEESVKILPKPVRRRSRFGKDGLSDDDDPDKVGLFGDEVGTPIYTLDQTELYKPPPVTDGRVPKNRFGNIDVYVPSMVPAGGTHILNERAAQAAFILGVDYAPALTGFEFKGQKGTAVLRGAVVPKEAAEGVRVVIAALEDMEREMEEERRSKRALRMWSRFLKVLRIRERVFAGADEMEEEDSVRVDEDEVKGKGVAEDGNGKGKEIIRSEEADEDADMAGAASDVSEEYFMEDDDEGGGFLVGDVDDDDDMGGGFVIE
ncbi:hypothetical protein B0T16DRAFT_357092 [Cercophora newfieldiana]|uniref:Rad4-domain-containing protein n=1 Tax=Cercophora newfieldiana TaxID=92897 RepID=A0AA40CKJ4_9PEZI|nr:hypothetical protein B0T16DRAFT_357092 [Cercophora newfieldiana]